MKEDAETLRGQISQLEETIKLRERVARLEARVKAGPGPGSPQAMNFREPAGRYLISPRTADAPSAMDALRIESALRVGYEPM